MTVKNTMERLAKENGASLSKNADKIIAIKEKAVDEYQCPCYPNDDEHWCISQLCKTELYVNGKCHCGLFVKDV